MVSVVFKSLFTKLPELILCALVLADFSSLTWSKAVPKTEPDIVPKLNTPLPLVWRTWLGSGKFKNEYYCYLTIICYSYVKINEHLYSDTLLKFAQQIY